MSSIGSPEVSVAIAAFDGERFIRAQLDSIAAQSSPPAAIVVSDDGSTDGTVRCVEAFAARSPIPVRLVSNRRQRGVIGNFMNAFDHCSTEWIAYCDQDDVWHPEKLAACSVAIGAARSALVFHDSLIADAALRPTGDRLPRSLPAGRYPFPHVPDRLWAFGHQMVFSKATLGLLRQLHLATTPEIAHLASGFDEALLVAAGMVGDIHYLPREFTTFRRHAGSVSPAAKAVANPGPAADDRRLRIASRLRLLDELREAVDSGAVEPLDRRIVLHHLDWLARRERRRLGIYQAPSWSRRCLALGAAAAIGAYGSMRRNALPTRQLAIDAARALGLRGG